MTNTITAKEATKLIQEGNAVIIDVREADEFKTEHIANALSVPLSSLEKGVEMLNLPEDKTVIFQCLKGSRGQMAYERIQNLGTYKNTILNVEGGIEAWKEQGLPVIQANAASSTISLFRQIQITVGFLLILCVLLGFGGAPVAFIVTGLLGCGLLFAGLTGWCGLGMVLARMPWNK